jgi:hypothetical protein
MGSSFSSVIDRSKCVHKTAFEVWTVTALAAAACRAASFCGGGASQVANDGSATARAMAGAASPHRRAPSAFSHGSEGSGEGPGASRMPLRELRITRIQFHDIFVDFSYILPVLATATVKAAELAAAQRAAERADKAKKPGASTAKAKADADAAAAAASKEVAEQVAEVTAAFKGLRDDVFNTFLSREPAPRGGRGAGGATRDDPYANDPALQRVRAVDVFAALAVMCKGTAAGKAALLYHLFSDDYPWDMATVGAEPWLLAAHPADCVDSIRVTMQVRHVRVSATHGKCGRGVWGSDGGWGFGLYRVLASGDRARRSHAHGWAQQAGLLGGAGLGATAKPAAACAVWVGAVRRPAGQLLR